MYLQDKGLTMAGDCEEMGEYLEEEEKKVQKRSKAPSTTPKKRGKVGGAVVRKSRRGNYVSYSPEERAAIGSDYFDIKCLLQFQ